MTVRSAGALAAAVSLLAVPAALGASAPATRSASAYDRTFLVDTMLASRFQLVAGKMALQRSPTASTRAAAGQIAGAQWGIAADLAAAARSLRVPLPPGLSATDHWDLHEVGTYMGLAFDGRWSQLELAHAAALADDVRFAATHATSPAIRRLARRLLPTVESHLALARSVA